MTDKQKEQIKKETEQAALEKREKGIKKIPMEEWTKRKRDKMWNEGTA